MLFARKATPPRELDFDLSLSDLSPAASDRQFMRRSQSFSAMAYSPTQHQRHQEYHQPQYKQAGPTGFPTPVTPTRSHQGLGAVSLHTPSGTTMPSGQVDAITRSDSKYSSQTVASRAGDQRRARQQRRKTDGSDEILSVRRPSTSHASSPPRKVAYSQYPDFENITDPFAKRDKIPQKSERPFLLDVVAAPAAVSPPAPEPEVVPKAVSGKNKRGGAKEEALYTAAQAPVRSHSQQHKNIGDGAPRSTTKQSGQAVAVPSEACSGGPSPETPIDAQAKAPTPLRTRDKIPRHKIQPEPSQEPSARQLAGESLSAPLRKESLGSSSTKLPVTPTKPRAATGSSTSRSMGRSLLISSLVSPVSPIHPASTGNRLRIPGTGSVPRAPPPLYPVDSEASVLSAPVRPFSGHLSSPRLQIDMDKVETLYERRSVIFEKNRSRTRDRSDSTASSPLGSQARSPLSAAGAGLPAMAEETDDAKDSEHAEEADDHESEHIIPFDQVLIPTAFKRLRKALEDPSFEIDEETYRRFKLSERWYSREEQMQMERAFTSGTFGESKKRSRIIQKRLSELSADSSALGSGHAAVRDMPEGYRGQSELPTPPASAMALDNQHCPRLESLQEEEALDGQAPHATAFAAPERRRTRSSRKPSHRTHRNHQGANDFASSHPQVPLPGEYAPPQLMDLAYATQPKAHMQSADHHLQQLQQPTPDETTHQDPRHRTSRNQRSAARPSTSAAEQTAKSSGGCCGCTIM
ncbi:hypothetical protein IWW37_002216 [Coemansia sp. RSA 2050]|nr:hypothetical protein IWW37_002216 [Coemansia sp. RSA 2050]